jgi:hypothetical protein
MFYKLINNGRILDVLKNPLYCRLQKNGCLITCSEAEADGVISSDGKWAYQTADGNKDRFITIVDMVEITQSEYEELSKIYPDPANVSPVTDETYNSIIDDYTKQLIGEGVL